jgi:hypothetical protein
MQSPSVVDSEQYRTPFTESRHSERGQLLDDLPGIQRRRDRAHDLDDKSEPGLRAFGRSPSGAFGLYQEQALRSHGDRPRHILE